MDPRLRAGLIAGSGAAVAVFLTSFVCFCLTGPFIAALAGASAGLTIARDARYAQRPGEAGAVAGLYAGIVVALAQLFGMTLAVATQRDELASQVSSYGYHVTPTLLWWGMIFWSVIAALVDVGIMAGAGAIAATNAAKRLYGPAVQRYAPGMPRAPQPLDAARPTAAPAPPAFVPPPAPPPPPSYPPPPSFYGMPDAASLTREADAPPDNPEV